VIGVYVPHEPQRPALVEQGAIQHVTSTHLKPRPRRARWASTKRSPR